MSNPVTPLNAQQTAEAIVKASHEGYIHRDLVSFDDLVNTLADGNPDETISSRMGRWAVNDTGLKKDIGVAVCDALGLIQHNHDAKAVAADYERAKKLMQVEENSGIIQPKGN